MLPTTAALTEPMAVALHAVRRGEVGKRQVAYVIGCGPIGLGVIAMLKASGVRRVVASDFSPGRRALATAMGADVVVDPATASPYSSFSEKFVSAEGLMDARRRHDGEAAGGADAAVVAGAAGGRRGRCLAVGAGRLRVRGSARRDRRRDRQRADLHAGGRRRRLHGRRPDPAVDRDQQGDRPAVRARLHAAGVPRGAAPAGRRQGRPDPADHRHRSGLDGVADAFEALADPEAHAKILVEPRSSSTL